MTASTGFQVRMDLEPAMSQDTYGSILQDVIDTGKGRWKAQGEKFVTADYLAGAMTVLAAFGLWGRTPASWTLGIMVGYDPITGKDHTSFERPEPEMRGLPKLMGDLEALLTLTRDIIDFDTSYGSDERAQVQQVNLYTRRLSAALEEAQGVIREYMRPND